MAKYPKLDLPTLPAELELRLQSEPFLEQTHTISEDNSYFFSVAHTALRLAVEAGFDTPQFRHSVNTGVKIFESLGYLIEPDAHYDDDVAKAVVYAGAMEFVESLKSSDDFLTICDFAATRMEADAPNLTDAVQEIAGRYVGYDDVAIKFAVRGASAMRGMQIFVDKRLEAVA